ncbi:MAG: GNAT family N-acetyltransferase, partial [Planktomarina sp.]
PSASRLFDAIDVTWPALRTFTVGGWTLRDGGGGGKRASAATLDDPKAVISEAEAQQNALGQDLLFMIRTDGDTFPADQTLDKSLENQGYRVIDPVNLYACPIAMLVPDQLPISMSYPIWPPVQVQRDIWNAGGIGPARVDLMHRCQGSHSAILARHDDTPSGVGFVALDGDIAMIHAVEVLAANRRQGVARLVMDHAATWAQAQGAKWMALATTRDNVAANALYQSLGMTNVGQYHYRIKDAL